MGIRNLAGNSAGLRQLSVLVDDKWVEIKLGTPLHAKLFKDAFEQQQKASGIGGSSRSPARRLSMQVARRAPQAVVKIVRNGGTNTARGARNQMEYLQQDGAVPLEREATLFGFEIDEQSLDQQARYWSSSACKRAGADRTTHFIVSFPQDTDHGAAYRAGRAWAEELFDSGNYGDTFSYYTAFHTDKDHPHMHVVVRRRGTLEQTWLKVSKRSEFNYDRLRMVQVETAAQEGIVLEASPRLARGITHRPPTDAEIRRAEREGREPVAPSHTTTSALKAAANLVLYANQFSADAKLLAGQYPDLAKSLRQLAGSLIDGQAIGIDRPWESKPDEARLEFAEEKIISSRDQLMASMRNVEEEFSTLPEGPDRDKIQQMFNKMLDNMSQFLPEAWASRGFVPLVNQRDMKRQRDRTKEPIQERNRLSRKDDGLDL